jgi:hypothetical protein
MKKGRITQEEQNRRIKLLTGFVFNFRYATLRQLHTFIQLIMNLSYSRRLIAYCLKYGYLKVCCEPVFKTKIYYLTQKGKDLLYGDEALVEHYHFEKSLTGVNTFTHHNMLADVYFMLKAQLNIKDWLCEWVLRVGLKKYEKIPDALFILPDGTKIALEVETRYKDLSVLKCFVSLYQYDIMEISKYHAVLVVASTRVHYEGLKKRLLHIALEFCSERFIFSDVGMLEQGMCFYQDKVVPLEEAIKLLNERR